MVALQSRCFIFITYNYDAHPRSVRYPGITYMSSEALKKRKSKVLRSEGGTPEMKRGRSEGDQQVTSGVTGASVCCNLC